MSPEKDTASEHPWIPGVFRISVNPLTLSFCGDIANLLGRYQYIDFAPALWNGKDPILQERMFGLYRIRRKSRRGCQGIFHKPLLNFTWWVNKKDADGNNVFQGGFLGLDNISVFDRSVPLPTGGHIDQSAGTAWIGLDCLVMLKIAPELAKDNPIYQDTASKFFYRFLRIARAMTGVYRGGMSLWNEEDGFFYDALHLPAGCKTRGFAAGG